MSNTYNQEEQHEIEAVVSLTVTYKSNPPRVEECHGLHTFNEDEAVSSSVERVTLWTCAGELDITDRLTTGELMLIKKTVER